MQRGRPKAQLIVPPEDLATLQRWTARRKTAQALALRSQILLRCASGLSNTEVARELGVVNATVGKWRSRYIAKGLAGLLDEQRCGAPRRIGDDQVEAVLVKTLETTPRDATHWSTRSMAAGTGLSRPTINRIWRAFGLQPHRAESFKLSNDPQFIEKVRDIVGLYLNPPERALVLCTDEKAQIQALDRTQPIFPMRPGMPELRTTTTADTAPLLCSPPSTSPAARSSASFTGDTARPSSATSSIALTRKSLTSSTCTWSSTTTAPTRRR